MLDSFGIEKAHLGINVRFFRAYRQASACISACPNGETKNVILNGLQYLCVDHFTGTVLNFLSHDNTVIA